MSRQLELFPPIYIYAWGPRGKMPGAMDRKGQRCKVLARGRMNSALIEFEDSYIAVVSRSALRRSSSAGVGVDASTGSLYPPGPSLGPTEGDLFAGRNQPARRQIYPGGPR